MRRDLARAISALVVLCSLLSCSRTSTVAEAIYIPGNASVDEKLTIAQEIGKELWEGGLTQRVHERFPDLTEDQLSGVFLRWEAISVTPATGNGEPATGVRIRTGIQHRGGVAEARAIAKLCADSVEGAIRRRTGVSKVYRIDISEQSIGL